MRVRKKTKEKNQTLEEDVIVEFSRFQFYFQKKYTIISLLNDLLTGIMYLAASIFTLLDKPAVYGNTLYLLGAVFLTIRPLLRIMKNVFVYRNPAKQENEDEEDE